MWKLTYKWAKHSHPNKSKRWVVHRYFGTFNKSRRDRWVFGDRDSGAYLLKYAWTKIVRHQMVQAGRHPTTRPWPTTGPDGDSAAHPRWTASACACSRRSTDAARPVVGYCCTPTMSRKPPASGSSGSR